MSNNQKFKCTKLKDFENLVIQKFDFVSDFEIRISDFNKSCPLL